MQIQGIVTPSTGLAKQMPGNTAANAAQGFFGELYQSDWAPDYYSLVKSGKVFTSALAAANPAAFTGGAAGTPLIGLYNPANSGTDLILLDAFVAIRTTGTVAGNIDFNHWGVNQGGVAVTGANTAPRNLYSFAQTGSVATAMQNVANTGALASALIRPSISLGAVAASAAVIAGVLRDEIKGEIVVPPGTYYAFGASAALTGGSLDVGLLWAELPV
jgi:hypothetical protein